MMLTPSSFLFLLILFVSTILSISSSSWLGAWLGLEINLMSFIPIIMKQPISTVSECAFKYFLVQAMSSLLFLMSLIYGCWMGDSWFDLSVVSSYPLVFVALLIKLGSAPFHQWFPSVASGLPWVVNLIMMTWQKLAPLVLVTYIISFNFIFVASVGLSCILGSLGGINQSSMRKLLAYSSINHLGWMLMGAFHGVGYALLYYLVYSMTSLVIVYMLLSSSVYYLSQAYTLIPSGSSQLILMLNWMSFGGLPPLVGFFPKWMVISLSIESGQFGLLSVMIFMSLFSLFYYVRVMYAVLAQSNVFNKLFNYKEYNESFILVFYILILSGLLFIPLLVLMI